MRQLFLFVMILFLSSCSLLRNKIAVNSGDRLASETAIKIMSQGGNVIDAFIASSFVLSLVEPGASGLGGGFLAVYYDARKDKFFAINARESQASKHQNFKELKKEIKGKHWADSPAAIGIPGQVAGMELLYRDFGSFALKRLIKPAKTLAGKGFKASEYFIKSHKNFGIPINYQEGEFIKDPEYLKTLEILETGLMNFYTGEIADAIVKASDKWISQDDLLEYKAFFQDIHGFNWQNSDLQTYSFYSIGLPSAGSEIIKKALSIFDSKTYFSSNENQIKEYLKIIRPGVEWRNSSAADPAARNPNCMADENNFDQGTSHISLIDQYGNMLAATMTIQRPFGHKKKLPGYGFYLNNELTDFSKSFQACNSFSDHLLLRNINGVEFKSFKRPLSSMTPMIVLGPNKEKLITGGTGGWTIFSAVLETSLALLEKKQSLQETILAPRLYTKDGTKVLYDRNLEISAEDFPDIQLEHTNFPLAINAIHIKDNNYQAFADPRKNGFGIIK